jgi:hypothetical protein
MSRTATKEEKAIATRPNFALAERSSLIKEGDRRGTESLSANDIRPPSLRLAQSTTPETKRANAAYIEDLAEGELFNSLTREVYGEGPVYFAVVRSLGHRNVEFRPMAEGGGVVDFNVPDSDPRTQFTIAVKDGKNVRVKPVATLLYDYLILLLKESGERELMTLSLKGTQLKKAKDMNTYLFGSKLPTFAHVFSAAPVPESKNNFNYYGWRIERIGFADDGIVKEADATFQAMQGKTITVETEADDVEAEAERAADAPRTDKVPF